MMHPLEPETCYLSNYQVSFILKFITQFSNKKKYFVSNSKCYTDAVKIKLSSHKEELLERNRSVKLYQSKIFVISFQCLCLKVSRHLYVLKHLFIDLNSSNKYKQNYTAEKKWKSKFCLKAGKTQEIPYEFKVPKVPCFLCLTLKCL